MLHIERPVAVYVIVVGMACDCEQNICVKSNADHNVRTTSWKTAYDLVFAESFISEERHFMLEDFTSVLAKGTPAVEVIDFDYAVRHTSYGMIQPIGQRGEFGACWAYSREFSEEWRGVLGLSHAVAAVPYRGKPSCSE